MEGAKTTATDLHTISPAVSRRNGSVYDDKIVTSKDIDPALAATGGQFIEFTPEEETTVLRKIDLHILPLMCWVYAIQFADKVSLNYASIMGIREDTHLDPNSQQYSWASSIFYAGYILWE